MIKSVRINPIDIGASPAPTATITIPVNTNRSFFVWFTAMEQAVQKSVNSVRARLK